MPPMDAIVPAFGSQGCEPPRNDVPGYRSRGRVPPMDDELPGYGSQGRVPPMDDELPGYGSRGRVPPMDDEFKRTTPTPSRAPGSSILPMQCYMPTTR